MQAPFDSDTGLPSPHDLTFLSPEHTAARTMQRIEWNEGENRTVNRQAIAELLEIECKAVAGGDLTLVRRTLAAQIRVLERLYDHLLDRAMGMGPVVDVYERYLNLAFRAQAQLNRTVALLERYTRHDKIEQTKARSKPTPPRGESLVSRTGDESRPLRQAEITETPPEARCGPLVV